MSVLLWELESLLPKAYHPIRYRMRTPAEPMPPPIKEPPSPMENPDAPVREPDPDLPEEI